ncbi:hypothetical protein RUM43_002016 [Polyplax serrata]|uniref:Uncharacterized protein n=1 Tax=Polyplax serrata TaxID=468196 RepID=A0AAN8NY88_POLSC
MPNKDKADKAERLQKKHLFTSMPESRRERWREEQRQKILADENLSQIQHPSAVAVFERSDRTPFESAGFSAYLRDGCACESEWPQERYAAVTRWCRRQRGINAQKKPFGFQRLLLSVPAEETKASVPVKRRYGANVLLRK